MSLPWYNSKMDGEKPTAVGWYNELLKRVGAVDDVGAFSSSLPRYVIYKEGLLYYAMNGYTGEVEYVGYASAPNLIETVINLGSGVYWMLKADYDIDRNIQWQKDHVELWAEPGTNWVIADDYNSPDWQAWNSVIAFRDNSDSFLYNAKIHGITFQPNMNSMSNPLYIFHLNGLRGFEIYGCRVEDASVVPAVPQILHFIRCTESYLTPLDYTAIVNGQVHDNVFDLPNWEYGSSWAQILGEHWDFYRNYLYSYDTFVLASSNTRHVNIFDNWLKGNPAVDIVGGRSAAQGIYDINVGPNNNWDSLGAAVWSPVLGGSLVAVTSVNVNTLYARDINIFKNKFRGDSGWPREFAVSVNQGAFTDCIFEIDIDSNYIDGTLFTAGSQRPLAVIFNAGDLLSHVANIRGNTLVNEQAAYSMTLREIDDGIIAFNSVTKPLNLTNVLAKIFENPGYRMRNKVLSPPFAIDAVATVVVTIPHGLAHGPGPEDCVLTLVEETNVDDFALGFIKVDTSTPPDAVNVYAKVRVTGASATVGATARLMLLVEAP